VAGIVCSQRSIFTPIGAESTVVRLVFIVWVGAIEVLWCDENRILNA
jgi:hypothetical protein